MARDSTSPRPLAIFRIGLALITLMQAFVLWRHRHLLLDEFGLVPWMISDPMTDPLQVKVSHVAALLSNIGIGANTSVTFLLATHTLAALLLLVGYRTRTAAIATWLTYLPLKHTGFLFTYGLGAILLIGLFYCMFMPVGRAWSLDAGRAPTPHDSDDVSISVVVLRLHLCIVYAAAGISKAAGIQWWTGDALWRALSLPQFQQFDPAPLLTVTPLLQAVAIGSVLLQVVYPVLVWTRLRAVVVFFTELMHLAIAVFLGLWLFSLLMMVINAGAFGEALWRAGSERWRAWVPSRSAA